MNGEFNSKLRGVIKYPRLVIETVKLQMNEETIVNKGDKIGLKIDVVIKAFAAEDELVQAYIDGGVKYLADSRMINFKRLQRYDLPKMLLRLPMISETKDVVQYTDISLNSELDTVKALSEAAKALDKIHNI